jgi:hypothetical protein
MPERTMITGDLARTLPRFEFIARYLVAATRKKSDRGPLGLYVRKVGKWWRIYSPVDKGTITYQTTDPALLFDYARRGQLGHYVRSAEEFRGLAFEKTEAQKTETQISREVDEMLAHQRWRR